METMSLKALANKVLQGNRKGNLVETEIKKVETLARENGNPRKLIEAGKLQPLPYLDNGILRIPFDSPQKYHWWNRGQSIKDTLRELGASDEILKRYKSPYSDN